jgi:hypothetical protein
MEDPRKRAEMTKELRTARTTLIAVGLLMFAIDMLMIHVLQEDVFTDEGKRLVMAIDAVVLGIFLVLAAFVRKKPRLCLTSGLVLFWALQLLAAVDNPRALTQGVVVKVLFTLALVNGIKSASRARVLQRELTEVFE